MARQRKLRKKASELTHARLLYLLSYNQHTGALIWNFDRGRTAKKGDLAGAVGSGGQVLVGIDGNLYTAGRLAWFYINGEWPKHHVRFRDGDPENLRPDNLTLFDRHRMSTTRTARRQRRYRREKREVDRRILNDPQLRTVWENTLPENQDNLRHMVLEQVRYDHMRERGRYGDDE